jgi:glycosyltransferase involved in cell wall biosynthesis
MILVSIIIPCFNEEKTIRLLLKAIHEQTFPNDQMEVIIADGISEDNTRSEIAAFCQEHPDLIVRVIDNHDRHIPAALNRAIEASNGEFIIRMDAHSVPSVDYVERCLHALQAELGTNVGGVWDIQPQVNTWIAKSIALAASHPMGVGGARYRYTSEAGEVDTVPFGAFRRETLERVGKFDETLLSNEDYELNARIRQSGGRIWLDPQIRTVYYARPNLSALSKQYWRYGFWKQKMLKRYPETLRWRQALPPVFVLSLIVLFVWMLIAPIGRYFFVAEVTFYLFVLLLGAIPGALKKMDWKYLFGIPLAIMTMHIYWGAGFLWSFVDSLFKNKR